MSKILYFDYSALVILVILIISTILRKMTKGRANKAFLGLLLVVAVSVIADILAVWLDNSGAGHLVLKYLTHTGYLWFHNITPPLYLLYLLILSDTDHMMRVRQKIAFTVPFMVVAVLLILNPWNKLVFYMNAQDAYTRGPLFFLLYASAAYYILLSMVHLIRYRSTYGKTRFFALFSVVPLMVAAVIAQLLVPRLLTEMLANSLCLLLISTMVQRAEDFIDTDTELGKRSAYVEDMGRAMKNGKSSTVVMINLTNYTALRDMLGYSGMQAMLKHVSKMLIDVNREKNYGAELYYLGNGKFRFVLDYRHLHAADTIAQELNRMLKPDVTVNGMELNLVALVCVARCPGDIDDADSLMAFGNDLTNRYYTGEVLYAADIYQKKHYDIIRDMDAIIENALVNHQFEVYYQPIYSVEDNRFHSAEALLRLKDEEYGFISPELFIPVAEKNGAIHKIGSYVMEEVCKFIASEEYQTLGIDFIEINLSVTQCMRTNLAKDILDTMNKYHVRPDQINLEITETAASYSQNTMMENIEVLTDAGIMFSLDDYGTGYSNMRRIASMPFDIVKLDKSFTNAEHNSKMRIVLENTIRMIKDMDMKIVVEGIETEKMVEQFSDLKCEYIQGFYYSKPVPKDEFVSFVRTSIEKQEM